MLFIIYYLLIKIIFLIKHFLMYLNFLNVNTLTKIIIIIIIILIKMEIQ